MRAGACAGLMAAVAAAMVLAACKGMEHRLDDANALRHAGKSREALQAYQDILAEMGEGRLAKGDAALRLRALTYAADVSYLEVGDFIGAVSYYRRIISLYPGTEEAWRSRARIGDIFAERLQDRVGAIAQYADVAASNAAVAAEYQLKVAQQYLELKNYQQVRTEARILRERWPEGMLADEAQLLTAQAWTLEKHPEEALGALRALLERKPRPDIVARALAEEAHIFEHFGVGRSCGVGRTCLDRAAELYEQALANHPNPEAIRMNLEAVRRRRDKARPVQAGDRDAAFDRKARAAKTQPAPESTQSSSESPRPPPKRRRSPPESPQPSPESPAPPAESPPPPAENPPPPPEDTPP